MTITVRSVRVRGEKRWCVDALMPDGRKRQFFKSQAQADRVAAGMRKDMGSGEYLGSLMPAERKELETVHRLAVKAGTTPMKVWMEWNTGIRDAPSSSAITLGSAINLCVAAKTASGRRKRYLYSLGMYLRAFAVGRTEIPLQTVSHHEVMEWVSKYSSLQTRSTWINRISTLYEWAIRAGHATVNPCKRVERIRVEQAPPKILSVDQCDGLLRFLRDKHPEGLAWFSIAMLAGARPSEVDRLSWSSVDVPRGIITIDAAASKVRTRRIIHLLPCAKAWLAESERLQAHLPLRYGARTRIMRYVRDHLGLKHWPQDILRHTAASYWLAHRQDAGAVAHELGNSAGILLRVYRELVSREDAERWVALMP